MRREPVLMLVGFLAYAAPSAAFEIFEKFAIGPRSGTVIVPAGGTATENGTDLLNAVSFVSTQSPADGNRWRIQLEPGIFDVESNIVTLPDYVSLTGSGIETTEMLSNAFRTVDLCSFCDIADLTVHNVGASGSLGVSTLQGIDNTELVLRNLRVELESSLDGDARALNLVGGSDIHLRDVHAVANQDATSGNSFGVDASSISGLVINDLRAEATGTNSVDAKAMKIEDMTDAMVTGAFLSASAASAHASGLDSTRSFDSDVEIGGTFRDLTIDVSATNDAAFGIHLNDAHSLTLQNVIIDVTSGDDISGTAKGIWITNDNFGGDDIRITNCRISLSVKSGSPLLFVLSGTSSAGLDVSGCTARASCSGGGTCYAANLIATGGEILPVTIHDTRLVSTHNTSDVSARGIELVSVDAEFDKLSTIAPSVTMDVDASAPAAASTVRFVNGLLDSGAGTYLRGDGSAVVNVYNSTLEGASSSQGTSTLTCAGNVIGGTFTASGC